MIGFQLQKFLLCLEHFPLLNHFSLLLCFCNNPISFPFDACLSNQVCCDRSDYQTCKTSNYTTSHRNLKDHLCYQQFHSFLIFKQKKPAYSSKIYKNPSKALMELPDRIEFPLIPLGEILRRTEVVACSGRTELCSKLISVEFHKWLK